MKNRTVSKYEYYYKYYITYTRLNIGIQRFTYQKQSRIGSGMRDGLLVA